MCFRWGCLFVKLRSSFLLGSTSSRGAVRFVQGCLPRRLGRGFSRSRLCCFLSLVSRCCSRDKVLSIRPSTSNCISVSLRRMMRFVIGRTGGSRINRCSPRSVLFIIRKRVRCNGSLKRIRWTDLHGPESGGHMRALLRTFLLRMYIVICFILVLLLLLGYVVFFQDVEYM